MGIGNFFKRIFGTSHERMLRKIQPTIEVINRLEPDISALSDSDLKAQTAKFKEMLANGATLDDILPEAFATVRETSKRVLNMRHYDVQLIGGVALHRGMIAEMKTGEGKTLVATSPMYLNALSGKGAHLVTVNDYLAGRDADWMGQIYNFLGLSVGKILSDLDNTTRRAAYAADITYGTNNEFGFDYLRDNMKFKLADYVQRGHNYAIVDEVDSILIDEARTPLIISGQIEQDLNLYYQINKIVPFLKRDEDYAVDEKAQSVSLNESGIEKVEKYLKIDNIYDPKYIEHLHHVNKALQAHTLYKLDQNYVVDNGKVVIVDDFTGRLMPGRRWSDGLHQAIEAKEGVEIQAESRTLATITFQNYFRMYDKLAGMTGTADTEAEEFKKIYNLEVFSIPTSRPIIRKDYHDVVYVHEKGKFAAVVKQIQECHAKGQPVLVGTVSVEKSEVYSKLLDRVGIPHNVLNAKNHRREAEIIAQAGREGAVTIATNMAGRGTDILLGGNPEALARSDASMPYEEALVKYKAQCAAEKERVQAAGGLFILGTERHESRRIDNQLRGRAGRQGDPGASRFYLSFDDDLLRIFGGDKFKAMMDRLTQGEDEDDVAIESGLISNSIERAQRRVEGRNFDIRKSLIEYDDVMNKQRNAVYSLRLKILKGEDLENEILDAYEAVTFDLADKYLPAEAMNEDWNFDGFIKAFIPLTGVKMKVDSLKLNRDDREGHIQLVFDEIIKQYHAQIEALNQIVKIYDELDGDKSPYAGKSGKELFLELAQSYYLKELDQAWQKHLTDMTGLRESISFRGYAQKDPKQEYKREAYTLFEKMMKDIKSHLMTQLCHTHFEVPDISRMPRRAEAKPVESETKRAEADTVTAKPQANAKTEESKKPLSMAEMMRMAEKERAEKASETRKPASMADLMPTSIANEVKPKPAEPKRAQSMADLMPTSMMQAMLNIEEERKRVRERARREAEEAKQAVIEAEKRAAEEAEKRAANSSEEQEETSDNVTTNSMAIDSGVEAKLAALQEAAADRRQAAEEAMAANKETVHEIYDDVMAKTNADAREHIEADLSDINDELLSKAESASETETRDASALSDVSLPDPSAAAASLLELKDKLSDILANHEASQSSDEETASSDEETANTSDNQAKSSEDQKMASANETASDEPSASQKSTQGEDLFASLQGLDDFGKDDDFGFGDLSKNSDDILSDLFGNASLDAKSEASDLGLDFSFFDDDHK